MKNSLKILTLLVITTMFAACSKSPGKTSAKLNIISGNFSALLSSKANNGLFFYGRSNDGKVFTKRIDSDAVDLVFPNGTWNFYAISYESGAPTTPPNFTGKTYCGKTTTTFNGTDASLTIDLTNAGCNDPAFSNNVKYMTEYGLPSPKIFTCKNLSSVTGITSCDNIVGTSFNKGYATAYRITIYEGKNFGDPVAPAKVADSGCLRTEFTNTAGSLNSTDAGSLTGVHIPTNFGNGLNMQLEVFYGSGSPGTNTGCDGSLGVDLVSFADAGRAKALVSSGTSQAFSYELYVKSDAADVCRAPRLGTTNFAAGFGTSGSPYAICTKEQLDLLRTSFSTYKSYSFDLLTDIDYGMTKIAPIGEPLLPLAGGTQNATVGYGGTSGSNSAIFDGHKHKISNFIIDCKPPGGTVSNNHLGFFRKINDATVKSLTFNNAVVMCDDAGNDVGILAGEVAMTSGSAIEDIRVHGHDEGNQRIGGLIGTTSGGSLTITNVHVKGDFGGSLSVGGLIGNANSSVNISKSSFFGGVDGNKHGGGSAVVSNVGGIIGLATSATLSEVIVKAKRIEGSTTVGGFVGSASSSLNISDSYVEGNLRASAMTDGSASFTNLGGAVGLLAGGTFNNVLVTNIIKSSNRNTTNDHTYGGLVGGGSSSVCPTGSNIFYFGDNDPFYLSCGTSLGLPALKTKASFTFPMLFKGIDWDVATNPSQYSTTCSNNGEYHEISTSGTATLFSSTAVGPTDLILCNGSSFSIVTLANRASAFSTYTWVMPDEGKDTPRLTYEGAIEGVVPYLKRPCLGHHSGETQMGAGTAADPYWVCDQTQFQAMAGNGTYYVLQKNIFSDGTVVNPMAAGKYILDGNGFGLYNFNLMLPGSVGTSYNHGLFSTLTAGSVIKNLDLIGSKLNSSASTSSAPIAINAGLLAGENRGLISNVNSQIGMSFFDYTTAYADSLHFGGLVGLNTSTGTIEKSEVDVDTKVFKGGYSLAADYSVGAVVGKNEGLINGVRSHSSFARILQCTSNEVITVPVQENSAAFVGYNVGTLSEVSSEGESRVEGNPSTTCPVTYSGTVSPFVAVNTGAITDFTVRPKLWISNSSAPNYVDLVLASTGTISRGFVQIDSSDSFAFMRGQPFIHAADWDAFTSPGAFAPGTPACDSTGAGSYYNITSANSTAGFGPVVAGDVVYCNGSQNVLVHSTFSAVMQTAPVTMSNVLFIAEDHSCSVSGYKTSTTCTGAGGTWTYVPLPVGGTCSNSIYFNQTDCTGGGGTWSPASPTRFYDADLKFSITAGTLTVKKGGSALPGFNGTGFTVGSNFFNPGANTWMLNLMDGATDTIDYPDLVKTEGGFDQLGPIFN